MNIKKISLLTIILCAHIDIFYAAAGEEKESDRSEQNRKRKSDNNDIQDQKRSKSFRDEVIHNCKTNFAPLRQGFDLIGLNYDEFLETQREFIPEDEGGYECADNDFMSQIVINAESIIIERMQTILEQGFKQAINNKSDIDAVTRQIFDYVIYYKLSIGSVILQYLRNIPNILTDAVQENNLEVVNLLIVAGEEKESDLLDQNQQQSFRDVVIDTFKTQYAPLRKGFDLIGLNYDDFLKTQRDFIPEDGNECADVDNHFMHTIVVNVENIIIERMQTILEQGLRHAIDNQSDIDILTGQIFDSVIDYKLSSGSAILRYLINIPNLLRDAIRENNMSVLKLLIRSGVDVNAQDDNGDTPLKLAIQMDYIKVVEILIAAKVDVNTQNNHGYTPLMLAAVGGHIEIVQLLITAGVDLNTQSDPLGPHDLLLNNREMTALMVAAESGSLDTVQALITAGGEANIRNENKDIALDFAVASGHVEMVRVLIIAGSDVNAQSNDGQTPLMLAALNGYIEIVAMLIDAHADINLTDSDSEATLMLVVLMSNEVAMDYSKIIQILITAGANVDLVNNQGQTIFDVASEEIREVIQKAVAQREALDS